MNIGSFAMSGIEIDPKRKTYLSINLLGYGYIIDETINKTCE